MAEYSYSHSSWSSCETCCKIVSTFKAPASSPSHGDAVAVAAVVVDAVVAAAAEVAIAASYRASDSTNSSEI